MNQHDLVIFFIEIGVMLTFALIFGQVMRRLKQPVILGELIGGILLGPTFFGLLAPHTYAWLFPREGVVSMSLDAVVKIGMLFFLFVAGLEVNLDILRKKVVNVALTSLPGIAVPFCLGVGSVLLFPGLWNLQPLKKIPLFSIFIGVAMSISALSVIARTLMDLKLIQKDVGVIVMGSATINDLLGWSLFAVILSNLGSNNFFVRSVWISLALFLGLFALGLTAGRWVGQHALGWLRPYLPWPSSFIGIAIIAVLVSAALFEAIGIHAVFGAFLVGIALAQNSGEKRNEVHEVVYQFAISFFAPLYFVSLGLRADFIHNFDLPLVLLVLFVACVGKICGAGVGALASGMSAREALAVGFGMNARGAMEMILASVALDYGLIDQRVYVALIFMALVTSMLSGPMMQKILGIKTTD